MDDLSTLGPLALGLLAWALGLAALMTRRTGLCPQSGVLRRRSGSWNPGAQRRGMAPYQI